ncbi:MAG: murein L,D-transpeptidase catalytic domain family protein [Flavisolibacter sp.]
MRNVYLPLTILCLLLCLSVFPVLTAGSSAIRIAPVYNISSIREASSIEYKSNLIYDSLQLDRMGLSREALMYAYKGQQKLAKRGMLENTDILTVCDFTQAANSKRLYIIDVRHFRVLVNTYVAHGKNSGVKYATRFSNRPESLQSSLGFYITKNTYFGKHGLSLKLTGVERGINDQAERRAVVVHGADYIGDSFGTAFIGRSYGCPAVPKPVASKVINLIKDGTCLFIYHTSKSYLHGSRILNG